jgi:hypothetical protein
MYTDAYMYTDVYKENINRNNRNNLMYQQNLLCK